MYSCMYTALALVMYLYVMQMGWKKLHLCKSKLRKEKQHTKSRLKTWIFSLDLKANLGCAETDGLELRNEGFQLELKHLAQGGAVVGGDVVPHHLRHFRPVTPSHARVAQDRDQGQVFLQGKKWC